MQGVRVFSISAIRSLPHAFVRCLIIICRQALSILSNLHGCVCLYAGSLRALVDSMQMDLQMANARLYDELQTPSRDRSPSPARVRERSTTTRALPHQDLHVSFSCTAKGSQGLGACDAVRQPLHSRSRYREFHETHSLGGRIPPLGFAGEETVSRAAQATA